MSLSDTKVTQFMEDALAEVSFGEWLKRRRRAEGWTQKQLARQINCSISALRKMESEERRPSTQVVERLAEVFKIPQEERKSFLRFARGDWQAFSGGETEEAPWRVSRVAPRSNLPASITSFIGREKEQVEIVKLINNHRLITLTGSGGVGKTRLSLKVGGQVLGDYANGVWLVELASLNDPALLSQTVTKVFGIATQSDNPIEILINFLRAKTILLILDNCEHLLDACAQVIDTLLKNCPNLKILATSREPLGIIGESIYRVPSLELPDFQQILDNFRDYESVRLFEERAQLVQTDFLLTMENASFIAQICSRLDGIPLAIELAAAKVYMLSTKQIAEQLDQSFNLLTGGSRTALPRQQTIHASIEWSWGLLTLSEQIFMRQLSVFAGGWTLESAQAICDRDVLDLNNALVKKSLIMVNQETGRETHYRFHEIVRQYAWEKLIEANEQAKICTQHLKYYLQLSEQAEPALRGPKQIQWMSRLNNELYNIRAALEWADKTDVEAGLYLSGRLHIFWEFFDLRGGARWLEHFIQKHESKSFLNARAKALYTHGRFIYWFQRFAEARLVAQECLALYRTSGDKHGQVDGLLLSAVVGEITQKTELAKQALVIAQSINDTWRRAYAMFVLAWGYRDHQHIYSCLKEAFSLFQEVNDLRYMAECMAELGRLEMLNQDIETAQKLLNEATILFRELNIKSAMSNILQTYGRIAVLKGDYEQAYTTLQESAAIDEEYGVRMSYLFTHAYLGYLALHKGDFTHAHEILANTARDFFKDNNEIGVVFTLEGMASLIVALGRPDYAARLIGWADTTRERIDDRRPPIEQAYVDKLIAACLAEMGEVAFSDAYAEGKKMTMDEAVEFALQEN